MSGPEPSWQPPVRHRPAGRRRNIYLPDDLVRDMEDVEARASEGMQPNWSRICQVAIARWIAEYRSR